MKRSVFIAILASVSLVASADWSDNFDSYANGTQLHGVGGWVGWDNVAGAGALVTNTISNSPSNSVNITGSSDLVQIFTGATAGKWKFTGKVFIPNNFTGTSYFIMLNKYNHTGPYSWSTQISFDATTGLTTEELAVGNTPKPFTLNAWNDLLIDIDLDANVRTSKLNGLTLGTSTWYSGTGAVKAIAAIDLFANAASPLYYDNLALTAAPTPDPVSGKVTLQDFGGDYTTVPVVIEIRAPGSSTVIESNTVGLLADGTYSFNTTLIGTYDITAKASHWLRTKKANVVLVDAGATGVDFSLVNGDVDGDNAVTVFDYTALSDAFDTVVGDTNWNPEADLDGDDAVTVFDYAILSTNFDLVGDD